MSNLVLEHSTVTVWQKKGEEAAYRNMIERFPDGIVSIVSDSYNIYDACADIWGGTLKDVVVKRGSKAGNVVVIRPDSGDPATVVCKLLNILRYYIYFCILVRAAQRPYKKAASRPSPSYIPSFNIILVKNSDLKQTKKDTNYFHHIYAFYRYDSSTI